MSETVDNYQLSPVEQEDKKYQFAKTLDGDQNSINPRPVITKIRIGQTLFNIGTPKDWEENRPGHRTYIHGRSHYAGEVIFVENKATFFKDSYIDADKIEAWQLDHACDIQESPKGSRILTSHRFQNTYALDTNISTIDKWQVLDPWFNSSNKGKPYSLTFSCEKAKIFDKLICDTDIKGQAAAGSTDSWTYPTTRTTYTLGEGIELTFDPDTQTFSLSGEPKAEKGSDGSWDTVYPVSVENALNIQPCLTTDAENLITYTNLIRLDNSFIPVDGKSIKYLSNGKIGVDYVFDSDFQVTEQFGKYAPRSWVSAAGKTVKEVLREAFCEDTNPSQLFTPSIEFRCSIDTETGIYERGAIATLDWTVDFNPGSYSFGTDAGNASNVYVERLEFIDLYEEADEIYSENHQPADNGVSFSEDANGNYTLQRNNSDVLIPNMNAAKPEDKWPAFTGKTEEDRFNKGSYTVASGQFKIKVANTAKSKESQGNIKLNAFFTRDDEDYPVTILGAKPAENILEKVNFTLTNSSHTLTDLIYSDYKWFWNYTTAPTKTIEELRTQDTDWTAFFRTDNSQLQSCMLGKFPEKVVTKKMQQLFFAAPTGLVNKDSLTVRNERTGASAGIIYKTTGYIADATGTLKEVDEQAGDKYAIEDKYDIFYISNAEADSSTNTYVISYELNSSEGGPSE